MLSGGNSTCVGRKAYSTSPAKADRQQVQIFGKNAKVKTSKTSTDQENSIPE